MMSAAVIATLVAMAIPAPGASSSPASSDGARVQLFGSSLDNTSPMALDGTDLFVAQGTTVVEVNATTGDPVRWIAGPAYHFSAHPGPMLVAGGDLFVGGYDSVTEVDAATGSLVRVLSGPPYELLWPAAMASEGPDLFIASRYGGRGHYGVVSEVDVATGTLVRVLAPSSRDEFAGPDALATVGPDLFVASTFGGPPGTGSGSGSVTEFDAFTGALVRVIAAPRYWFIDPDSLTAAGDNLYVGSATGALVTELDAATGHLVRVLEMSKRYAYNANAASGDDLSVVGHELLVGSERPGTYDCSAITEVDLSANVMFPVRSPGSPLDTDAPCELLAQGTDVLIAGRAGVLVADVSLGIVDSVLGGSDIGNPTALAIDGPDLFVANADFDSVTELDAANGTAIRILSGRPYDLDDPDALAVVGDDLFIGDGDDERVNRFDVVEVNISTGALVRTLPPWRGRAPEPAEANYVMAPAFAVDGADLFISEDSFQVTHFPGSKSRTPSQPPGGWIDRFDTSTGVLSSFASSADNYPALAIVGGKLFAAAVGARAGSKDDLVFEFGPSTGKLIEALRSTGYRWDHPDDFAVSGPDLFVVNGGGLAANAAGSVTELDAASGAVVRTMSGRPCTHPGAIAASGGDVFVACGAAAVEEVEEVDAATGSIVRVVALRQYGLDATGGTATPVAVAVGAGRVFVANQGDLTVTEFPVAPGGGE